MNRIIIAIVFMSVLFGCSPSDKKLKINNVENIGTWFAKKAVIVKKGMVDEGEAQRMLKDNKIIISEDMCVVRGVTIIDPCYMTKTENCEGENAEMQTGNTNSFAYGYYRDRKNIQFLEVYKEKTRRFTLEKVDDMLIYYLYGVLFFYQKSPTS